MDEHIKHTMDGLQKNGMAAYYVPSISDIPAAVAKLLHKGDVISCGGSVTLAESGVMDLMRNGDYTFLDRTAPGLTAEDISRIYEKTFAADAYITSSNAVTENGELVNVDGNGNRVAAITFGPKSVIVIVGANKIVKNLDEAYKRIKTVAAPKNAERLNRNTPCRKLGHCAFADKDISAGCSSPDRICSYLSVCSLQLKSNRIKVIICPETLGY